MPINVLASAQSNATEVTADKVIKLLNYCNTHPEAKKWQTISQNIIRRRIIKECATYTYTPTNDR
jgi:hypothetical protein